MKLRNLPSLLLSTSSLLVYLINLCNSVAPDDLQPNCPILSDNQRALLDSCCYSSPLLAADRWVASDQDQDGMTWTEVLTGETDCPRSVMISNASDDWLITQYINTTLSSSGRTATDLVVDIQVTCAGNCLPNLNLFYYPNDTVVPQAELTALLDNSFTEIGPVINGSNPVSGITRAGFHLAIRAMGNISVTVNQISIVTTVCRENTVNLINFPEAYAAATGNCSANSELSGSGSLTGTCENNGTWTTSSSCVCSAGYFLDNGICTACPVGSYKSTAGNDMCPMCPQNSVALSMGSVMCSCQQNYRRPGSNPAEACSECDMNFFLTGESCMQCPENSMSPGGAVDSCMCESNRRTADGSTTTSGTACNGCQAGYFLMGEMCLVCPDNSDNTQPLSRSCTCKGQSVTSEHLDVTSMNNCSTCLMNWKAATLSPLTCMMCQDRSERPASESITTCSCVTGYQMKSSDSDCFAEVILPQERLTLKEGSMENPAMIRLNLSAASYGFNISVTMKVEQMPLSPSKHILVPGGAREAVIEIPGNDVALNRNYSITVNLQPGNNYIGDDAVEATIVDDDYVSIGFLDSQRKMFNESDDTINITLTKNATTAQEIQVNLTFPQGSSVSVDKPVKFQAGPPENVNATLRIQNDVIGSEKDESVTLELKLVQPMDFSDLIDLSSRGQLTIIIKDDDPPQQPSFVLDRYAIIGIAVGGAALLILIALICLVSICICRFNANRQGFYFTEEDKTANPPSMLRYSASLRSISSQTVVPIIDGKGQLAEKENEFYV